MTDHDELRPELRSQMGDWVMGYVHARKRRRRRITAITVSAVTMLALGTASAWVVLAPESVVDRTVSCYEQPRVDSLSIDGQLAAGSPVGDSAANAVDLCSALWQIGKLDQDADATHQADGKAHVVPRLVLCTHRDGTYAVFPASAHTGLSTPTPVDSVAFCHAVGLIPLPFSK